MKRKLIVSFSIIAIIVLGIMLKNFLAGMKEAPPKRVLVETKKYVKTQKVKYTDLQTKISASGRLISEQQVEIISEVAGKILEGDVPFKKGQSFRKGDILIKINSEEAVLALQSQKSRFMNTLANILPDLKVDYSDSYGHWESFFEKIANDKKLPELPKVKTKQEKIFLASRNILSDYYSIQTQEVRLAKYNIKAPFDGGFLSVALEVGSVANMGGRLAQIINTNKLELEVPVEIANADFVKIGNKVKISNEKGTKTWTGKVVRKSNFVDEKTQSISVFINVKSQTKNELFKGMYLKAFFANIKVNNSMEIPRNAVFNRNEIFVVQNGALVRKEIKIEKVNEKTLLFSGLPVGLELVVEPLLNMDEGTKVEIIK